VKFIFFELLLLQSVLEPIKTLVIILFIQSVVCIIADLSEIKCICPYEVIILVGYKRIRAANKNIIPKELILFNMVT
jgi:hypothetical protein